MGDYVSRGHVVMFISISSFNNLGMYRINFAFAFYLGCDNYKQQPHGFYAIIQPCPGSSLTCLFAVSDSVGTSVVSIQATVHSNPLYLAIVELWLYCRLIAKAGIAFVIFAL